MGFFTPQSSSSLLLMSAFPFAPTFLAAAMTGTAAFLSSIHRQHDRRLRGGHDGARNRIRIHQLVSKIPATAAALFPIYKVTFQSTHPWKKRAAVGSAHSIIRRRHEVPTKLLQHLHDSSTELDTSSSGGALANIRDCIDLIRPFTLLQAVGSLIVGCLIRTTTSSSSSLLGINHQQSLIPFMAAVASVYLSYGAGMVANDIADASIDVLDADHGDGDSELGSKNNNKSKKKSNRPIASGRISTRTGGVFAAILSITSIALSYGACTVPTTRTTTTSPLAFTWWTCCNIAVMLAYAFGGLQKILLVKNILVGWLGVSPLIMGATALYVTSANRVGIMLEPALIRLAIIGFATGTAREILKDAQDVDIDTIGNKATIPRLLGIDAAHKIAYAIVASCCIACWLPGYRAIFASPPFPIYTTAMALGTTMCIRASTLSLDKGQALFKKSIYVMLGGMIGGLFTKA
jgi:4-hydroxybenzoate polyprenyltransferase